MPEGSHGCVIALLAAAAKGKTAAFQETTVGCPGGKAEAPAAGAELIGEHEAEISFDDFCKVELRVAEIRTCERMKESKKLLHLTVLTASGSAASSPALPSGSRRRT